MRLQCAKDIHDYSEFITVDTTVCVLLSNKALDVQLARVCFTCTLNKFEQEWSYTNTALFVVSLVKPEIDDLLSSRVC